MKDLVFLGASTAFYEVVAMIDAANAIQPKYKVVALLDDNAATHGKDMRGVPVVGPLDRHRDYPEADFVFAIGSLKTRLIRHQIMGRLGIPESRFATIIHPSAVVDPSATVGPGCIVHPGSAIGNDAVLEPFSILAVNSAVGPYATLERYSMVTSLVAVLSSARIGRSAFVGSCSCVTEGVRVGRGSMIGAGTVVSRDVPDGVLMLGNPARQLNKFDVPEDL